MELTEKNPLDLSDEEIANFDWNAYSSEEESQDTNAENSEDTTNEKNDVAVTTEDDSTDTTVETSTVDTDSNTTTVVAEPVIEKEVQSVNIITKDSKPTEPVVDVKKDEPVESNKEITEPEVKENVSEIDYQKEYYKLLAPFKANGKMMQLDNIDDARTLMQMGANYNKKMAALKPNLKIVKMLENNDLLDEAKLNRLIDLDKKNPEAIKQLVKDSGIDVMDLDSDKPVKYNPTKYNVNDQDVELESVLSEIKDTDSYNTTLNIISSKWDTASQKILYEEPSIIPVINEHVSNGIYDIIDAEITKERMLGRLKGLTDLAAYKIVGDALDAAGRFNNVGNVTNNNKPTQTSPLTTVVSKTTQPKVVDPKLSDKKRAASSTKSLPSQSKDTGFNPLALSDEDFEKTIKSQYI